MCGGFPVHPALAAHKRHNCADLPAVYVACERNLATAAMFCNGNRTTYFAVADGLACYARYMLCIFDRVQPFLLTVLRNNLPLAILRDMNCIDDTAYREHYTHYKLVTFHIRVTADS